MAKPEPSDQPRKTPRQKRAQATVEAILEAAARILEGPEPEALTTNAIAERAGVGIGSLYQYFPGKTAIIAELIRRENARLQAHLADTAGRGLPLQQAIEALVANAVAHQLDRPRLARMLDFLEPGLRLGEQARSTATGINATVAALLRAQGLPAPETAARDLVAMAKGMIDAAGLHGETDRAALQRRVTAAITGYLGQLAQR
jgi:AcrR family transcriptional regulator